jgi:predicted  nucleic acid-binding Zn-ribbon protein
MSDYPADAARLQVENERLRADCERLRIEATRLASLNHALQAQLASADEERRRLRVYMNAIEASRPWRLVQKLRALVGRRW